MSFAMERSTDLCLLSDSVMGLGETSGAEGFLLS